MKDEWSAFAKKSLGHAEVYAFNTEAHQGHILKIKEDRPGFIQSYPTIVFYKNGEPYEHYKGERTALAFDEAAMRICATK